jgi:hypothetical protein
MLRSSRLLLLALSALATLAAAPAAHAAAKTATFTGVFEAERSVTWSQPRGVHLKDCKGDHYYEARGSDSTVVKTRKPFRVTVQRGYRGAQIWTFGAGVTKDPRNFGIEAGGHTRRELRTSGGTTGGWCGGGGEDPQPENDCGTRLPTWLVILQAGAGKLSFTMSHAAWMNNERLSYYDCTVVTPEGMSDATFGLSSATFKPRDVFDKRKRTIVVSASKSYGPDTWGVPNFGVDRTAAGKERLKLTLTRVR